MCDRSDTARRTKSARMHDGEEGVERVGGCERFGVFSLMGLRPPVFKWDKDDIMGADMVT